MIKNSMVNRLISVLIILALHFCTSKVEGQCIYWHHDSGTKSNATYEIPTGTWSYSAYFDSTIIEKSVFQYSYGPASFAYNIVFDNNKPDSILFIGYNEQTILPLTKKSKRTFWAGDNIQHWVLNFNDNFSRLTIREYLDPAYAHKADTNEYIYSKTDSRIETISKYFVSKILKGKYSCDTVYLELTDKLVSKDYFTEYYEIKGIKGVRTFSIAINFWEMIPQMDMIHFYNTQGRQVKRYSWSFSDGELILRNVEDIYNEEGDFVDGKVTDIAYRLKRQL